MNVADITPESIAQAVGGKVERDGSVVCNCPIHEASGTHNPSLVLTITRTKRILVHCRSQNCDAEHFRKICDHLVDNCGLPRSHVGGKRTDEETRYIYQHADGSYAWTKTKYFTKSGKKRFICEVWDATTKQWTSGRPDGSPLLFNLPAIVATLAAYPDASLLVVEGERDVMTAGNLGVLATTNADGAGNWRVEDTRKLIDLGVRKVVVCPDNDGPGVAHGITVAKTFLQVGVEVRWLELPGLGAKGDLSDWVPNQVQPDAQLHELIAAAPLFDAESLDWRSKLKLAGRNAGFTYRGDAPNVALALKYEPRLRDCFVYNEFRFRTEVVKQTPWCLPEWWEESGLTPLGHRAVSDADITELGNYLTHTYDFGASSGSVCRRVIHTEAARHPFDEIKDWIDALPDWDGTGRLDGWLVNYAGANTEMHAGEYLALIGSKYIMQVLNRALHPGAKADYALALVAPQGMGKDQVLNTMFSPYYREGIPSPRVSAADFALALAGSIVAHAAEMSAWRKADVEDQKAALTRCVDHGRRAYGYESRDYPRRTCLAFSTNDNECFHDTTGERRYWNFTIGRDRVDLVALRRDRDQLLAEALHRLKAGERHWPTPEEEGRLIALERHQNMPEEALELVAILERFITEEPLTMRPSRGDFIWKWEPRPQPLGELYLDAFFEKCFGMYAAVKRQGRERASKRDIAYCTTWLRERGWRRVTKQLSDGQRVVVWRVPDGKQPTESASTQAPGGGSPVGSTSTEAASSAGTAAAADAAAVTDAAGTTVAAAFRKTQPTQRDPKKLLGSAEITPAAQPLFALGRPNDPRITLKSAESKNIDSVVSENFYFEIVLGKVGVGLRSLGGLSPAAPAALEEAFPRSRFLAIDVETTGLSAARDGLRVVQICDGENGAMVIFDKPVPARALVVLADFLRGRRVVAHNARFEGSWLHEAGIDFVLDDTVLLFAAVRGSRLPKGDRFIGGQGGRVSLAALTGMVLGETLDKTQQVSDWAAPVLSEAQLLYALKDAVVTHRVWEALRAELHRKSKQHGVDIAAGYEDLRYSAAMAFAMERAGVGFDVTAHQAWMERKREPLAAIDAYLAGLDSALTESCIASGVQLDKRFQERLGAYAENDRRRALMKWPKTDRMKRLSFGREDLAAVLLADRLQPAERKIVETLYARADHVRGLATFGEPFTKHVVEGRLHGQLHAGGAVTGRYTSTDPNLQNIPTESEFRGFFRAPEGRVLVDVDYSQLELRVFAAISNDTKMIGAFEDGWDYHDLIVKRVGCSRRQAKAINFGIIFGMGLGTLAASLKVDDMTAGEYLRAWDEQAPVGAQWRADRPDLYLREQGLRTARRWIDYLDDEETDAARGTRPKNYPVQGSAADVMHRAMRLLFERYRDWPGNVVPVLTIHDEILLEADAGAADQVGSLLAEVMIEAFRDVFRNGPTRFLAIPGVGPTWAAAKADGEKREKALRASA
jgi:DNA polymerase I-like protein with 3'-5' exonuclease and polymerase domains